MYTIIYGDNLTALKKIKPKSIDLIYIDPPFNTGKQRKYTRIKTTHDEINGDRCGFTGKKYVTEVLSEINYNDFFDDYIEFLAQRIIAATKTLKEHGSFFLHIDWREVHYCKILLDQIFGRDNFMNEIIWAYDYGGRSKKKWSTKHDSILWYVKDKNNYTFNFEIMDRIPYMAPNLVGKEKAVRGKTPTDCYSDDTEVLTKNGWVFFSELEEDIKVATVDRNKNIHYYSPRAYHKHIYKGEMVHVKSQTVNLLITPDHKIYCKEKLEDDYNFIYASDLISYESSGVRFLIYNKFTKQISSESVIWPLSQVSTIDYSGNVYCITIEPYHTLIVRRNGKSCVCGNCWWHTIVPTNGSERTGYPTQKPIGILDRIIKVHSNPGDVVLDFFAGSGTTGESAAILKRSFVLIDNNIAAIDIMRERLTYYNPKIIKFT